MIAKGDAIDDASILGDEFMLQTYYPQKDQIDIQKQFGSGFAESLVGLSPGQWHGPVLSGYGVHLVYVHTINQPPAPVFAEVRERVQRDWRTEKANELNKKFYANLRDRYTIVIEEPAENDKLSALQVQTP